MGTVASYVTKCTSGDCTSFDASQGSWVKLAIFGIDRSETISDDLRDTMKNKPEEYYPTVGTSGLWGMDRFGLLILRLIELVLQSRLAPPGT